MYRVHCIFSVDCPRGTEWRYQEQACVNCPMGYFGDGGGCMPCPDQHTTLKEGAKYYHACMPRDTMATIRTAASMKLGTQHSHYKPKLS